MTLPPSRPARPIQRFLLWGCSFLAFPLAGLAATAAFGPVANPLAALGGGAVVGLVVGAAQALASSGALNWRTWAPASSLGMAIGLVIGSAAVGYRTDLGSLALMGAITGAFVGGAQSLALRARRPAALAWVLASPALWALGWIVTTSVGIDVERQYAVFGASGAIVLTILTGALLNWARPTSSAVSA